MHEVRTFGLRLTNNNMYELFVIMASVLVKLTYRRSLIKAIQDIMVD